MLGVQVVATAAQAATAATATTASIATADCVGPGGRAVAARELPVGADGPRQPACKVSTFFPEALVESV